MARGEECGGDLDFFHYFILLVGVWGKLTPRPKARRVKIRVQVLLHREAKCAISDSCGVRDAGRGCWALLDWVNSPKLKALFIGFRGVVSWWLWWWW